MTDKKITDLTALTAVADDDYLLIVDDPSGSATTKKITRADLVGSETITLESGKGITIGANTLDTNEWAALDGIHSAWTAFTPTWANITIGNATNEGYYKQIGKLTIVRARIVLGNTSSVNGAVTFGGCPATATYSTASTLNFLLMKSGGSYYLGNIVSSGVITVLNSAGTYMTTSGITSSVPNTWTTDDYISLQIMYEGA